MIAFDTNALVRIAIGDHPAEKAAALALIESERVLVLDTVLLETAWVLRSRYERTPVQVLAYFRFLAAAQNVQLQSPVAVDRALDGMEKGLDFADALHAALSAQVPFYTFDKDFQRKAARLDFDVRQIKTSRVK